MLQATVQNHRRRQREIKGSDCEQKAAANETCLDVATAEVLSEPEGVFTLKAEQGKTLRAFEICFHCTPASHLK